MDNMQDILKSYYAQGGKDLFLTEEELNELNIKQLGLGVLAGISLMGAVKMAQPDADSGVKPAPAGYVSPYSPQDYIPKGSVSPPTNSHANYGGPVSQLAHKAMQAIVEITNKAKAIPTLMNWGLDMYKRIEVQLYIDSIVKGNLEPVTKETVDKKLSDALVYDMQTFMNDSEKNKRLSRAWDQSDKSTFYSRMVKELADRSKQDNMGSFLHVWKLHGPNSNSGSTFDTLGTSTITVTHWRPYESATITVYDKYDWSRAFLLSPQELKEEYIKLVKFAYNANNINLDDDAYYTLKGIAEHHAIKVLPDEDTSQMLAREYAKAGKTVTAEELHKYRLVNIEYPASAVYTESQWNKLQQDIKAQQSGIVVVGEPDADDKSVNNRDNKVPSDTGDNSVRAKMKDLHDPTK